MEKVGGKTMGGTKRYKLVAPDGGWGYFIMLAAIVNLSSTMFVMGSFGIMYKDLIVELKINGSTISLINGIFLLCVSISGFLAGPLVQFISTRTVAFIASTFIITAALWMAVVNSVVTFILAQGVLMSLGFGMIFNTSFITINEYFEEKRLLAFSIVQLIIGVIAMFAPYFVTWSLEEYGQRGSMIIIAGVYAQMLVTSCLLQPVSKHMRSVEVTDDTHQEMKLLINKDDQKLKEIPTTPVVQISGNEEGMLKEEKKDVGGCRQLINELISLKSLLLSCTGLGIPFCNFSEMYFTFFLPPYLYSLGWSNDQVAMAISLYGAGDLAMRLLLIIANKWLKKIGSTGLYVIGVAVAFSLRLVLQMATSSSVILVILTAMGLSHCLLIILPPMVISETVSSKLYPTANGLSMLLSGVISIIAGPLIGGVRDLTGSYGTVFYILATFLAIVFMFWCIELTYKMNRHKRVQAKENAKKKNKT